MIVSCILTFCSTLCTFTKPKYVIKVSYSHYNDYIMLKVYNKDLDYLFDGSLSVDAFPWC